MAVQINIGAVMRDAGKSGRGLPQSKTLRAAREFPNRAERLGLLQPSGAFSRRALRVNRSVPMSNLTAIILKAGNIETGRTISEDKRN
jgi:hypothetical protein